MTNKLKLEVALDNAFCIMSEYSNLEKGYQAAFKYLYTCPITAKERNKAFRELESEFYKAYTEEGFQQVYEEIAEVKQITLSTERQLAQIKKSIDNLVWGIDVNRKTLGDTRMLDEAFRALRNLQDDYK
ncbi:hypothetical protein [Bacillus phage SBSphiJ4]|nr:hypothetical protein [Bacillus phage SBSphiJ4]